MAGIGFIAYSCGSGAAGTRYAHPAELLVLRTDGSFTGYRNSISEPDWMARSGTGEVVAAHNDAIVRVGASALTTLVNQRQLDRLIPRSSGLAAIGTVGFTASGAVFFRLSYYAAHKHGCANLRAELTAGGRVKVLRRSASGLTCG